MTTQFENPTSLPSRRVKIRPDMIGKTHQAVLEAANKMQTYKNAHVETATPERLLVMLYEGAIKFLNIAKYALEEKQIEAAHKNILKTEAIILELMSVLDMEVGGEIAINLFNLYDFMYRHLVKANINHDIAMIQEVIEILEDLRGAWDEAATIVSQMRSNGQIQTSESSGAITFAG